MKDRLSARQPPVRRRRLAFLLGATAVVLAGCGTAPPPPQSYVLGSPPAETTTFEPLLGRPIIEVRPVLLPDYLDVSDLLVRRPGNLLAASDTGRWAERLSLGVTRSLAGSLSRRLPEFLVTDKPPTEQAECRVLVDVGAFERYADGPVVLEARWSLIEGIARKTLSSERVSLSSPVSAPGDAALVEAMGRAVDGLADRIGTGIRNAGPACAG